VTGIEQMADEFSDNANMYSGTNWPGATNMAAWTNAMASRRYRAPPSSTRGRGFVQIDRLSIENVYVTNRSNGFSLSVPALQWKGFKAANGKVELGELKIDSDRLTVKTIAGEPVEIRGQKVSFQKKFEGTILPRLHPAVVQPMAFVIDAGYVRGSLIWRLKAFDDRLEAGCLEDQKRFLMCSNLDIPAYIKGPLPSHLTVEMREASQGKGDAVKVSEGSFKLGMKEFKIEPSGLEKSETLGPARLVATSRAGDTIFTYSFMVPDQPWKMEQRLTAVPPMEPEEILARIFHDKLPAELTENERKQVAVEKTGFGGWTPAKKEAAEKE
jgi:hypothetical protein